MRIIRQWLYYMLYIWWRTLYLLGLYKPVKQKTFKDENDAYTDPFKIQFLDTFDSNIDYNTNIESIFYNKAEFNEYVTNSKNELEKVWCTRILWENTPRGNVMMYYDAYKMGFAYFCDQKVISYDVLNAVAMKYVKIYRCRDFFMDESIVSKENISKLISVHYSEENIQTKSSKPNATTESNKPIINSTFAKFRDYSKENPNSKNQNIQSGQTKQTIQEPEQKKNTFIYLGKMNNFEVLQRLPKARKILAKFTSPLLDSIEKDSGIQREAFSYKQFKEQVKPKLQETDL